MRDEYTRGYREGYRVAVTILHAWAKTMNDPKAEEILNNAAFHLGSMRQRSELAYAQFQTGSKPSNRTPQSEG